jgi:hypothetical protein
MVFSDMSLNLESGGQQVKFFEALRTDVDLHNSFKSFEISFLLLSSQLLNEPFVDIFILAKLLVGTFDTKLFSNTEQLRLIRKDYSYQN